MQLLVGQSANFAGLALPNQSGFVFAPGLHMAVEAVVGKIDSAADEPLGPGAIPFEDFVPFLEPVQFVGNATPEFFWLLDRLAVNALVLVETLDVSLATEFRRTFKFPLLVQRGIDIDVDGGDGNLFCHCSCLIRRDSVRVLFPRRFYSRNLARYLGSGGGQVSYFPKMR